MTLFLRVIEPTDKAPALKDSISKGTSTYEVDPDSFAQVPGSPFAYWVSDRIRRLFKELPPFEGEGRTVRQGLATADDFRFVRAWWEVPSERLLDGGQWAVDSGRDKHQEKCTEERIREFQEWCRKRTFEGKCWVPFAKGGAYSPYYADIHLVVNWENSGKEMDAFPGSVIRNPSFYFRPGLTWPCRTGGLSLRALPAGCVFGHKGSSAFEREDNPQSIIRLIGTSCSSTFAWLVAVQLARTELAQSFEVGLIQSTPIPSEDSTEVLRSAAKGWALRHDLDSVCEVSHASLLPLFLRSRLDEFHPSVVEAELSRLQAEIDDICFKLYGIEGEDRRQIEEWARRGSGQQSVGSGQGSVDSEQQEGEGEEEGEEEAASTDDTSALLSWGVGVAFGRFDIRLATGERQPPPDTEPFDPIPRRSPGMVPEGGPVFRPNTGIYVDDPGHPDDLTACVRAVLDRVSQPVPDNLRQWLAKDFFPLHIGMYSKSRRKAPIYWQLSTSSGSYSVWVFIHAFTRDTLFRVQNDYVAPKLEHEMRRLESMRSGMSAAPRASEQKALAAQEVFVQELNNLLAEFRLVTPLWEPELDDGVVINSAPLWRLFPQNRAWQKELRSVWDALCAGKYDWSHMAIHLWPERVVPKCATDRSLAIAHGLEDVFWAEGADGKWAKRSEPVASLDELLRERESSAVKDSLAALQNAPAAGTGQTGRRGRSKGN